MIFGRHINRYYLRYAVPFIVGLLTLVAVDYLQLLIPNLYQMLINGINTGSVTVAGETVPFDMNFLVDRICMPIVLIVVSVTVGRFVWRIMFFGSAIRAADDMRRRMFSVAKDLSREYYQVNKVGSMMSLFTNDLETIRESLGWGIMMFFDAVFLCVLAVGKMWRMSPTLALLSLAPMLLLLAAATVVGKYMMDKWERRQEVFSQLSDFSQESFSGIAVIKAFVKEARELMAFKKLNADNEKANVDHTKASVLLRILIMLFAESVVCIILGYGGYLVWSGVFNAGQLIEFIGYFQSIVWPIMAVSELIDMTSRGKASLKRVSKLLDETPAVKDREDAVTAGEIKGGIEFRDLSFRYPDGEFDALSGVSFRIEPGEHVGIVGKTGSGKTTIVELILRIYNVGDGMLFIDGRDVNGLTIRSVRDGIAYVPQDNFLFSDTIERNIAFSVDGSVDHKIVEQAAVLSDVDGNISEFEEGYETVLGERGVTVSGGQKQRISIARALMKDAPILILDDSVSAVDTGTEKTILDNLKESRNGRTTILIAHRISTIERMDKIIYVDGGRVTAVGTHEELLGICPDYRKTVELQRLEEEGGGRDA